MPAMVLTVKARDLGEACELSNIPDNFGLTEKVLSLPIMVLPLYFRFR